MGLHPQLTRLAPFTIPTPEHGALLHHVQPPQLLLWRPWYKAIQYTPVAQRRERERERVQIERGDDILLVECILIYDLFTVFGTFHDLFIFQSFANRIDFAFLNILFDCIYDERI